MPTDLAPEARRAMDRQRGLRFAAGGGAAFVFGMVFDWTNGYLAAVFAIILLESPRPVSPRGGLSLMVTSFGIYAVTFFLFTGLLQYPVLFFVAVAAALAVVAMLEVVGRPKILVMLMLFAVLILPSVARESMSVAWTQAVWIPANLAIGVLFAWVSFAVFPPRANPGPTGPLQEQAEPRKFWRIFLGLAPVSILILVLGADHLLTLIYFGLFALQLADSQGSACVSPLEKLMANLVGVIVAIVAYELIVIAPSASMMAIVSLLVCCLFGLWLSSGRSDAILARSALTAALILLGDAMSPVADTVEQSALIRVAEIGAAVVLALAVYMVLHHILPDRQPTDAQHRPA